MQCFFAARGMHMLRTVLLLLLWHLLWAPAHGSPALARGSGSALNDAVITASKAEFGSLAAQQPPSIGTPASTAAATTSAVPSSLSYAHNLSTARRLLQPPGLPPEARDISLQELLSSIGVSSDGSGGVRVTLPPVPPPNRSSSSNKSADNRPNERGLPAVAVNIKLSDLGLPEPSGRRLLSTGSRSSTTTSSSTSSATGSMSSSPAKSSSRHLSAVTSGSRSSADSGLSASMRSNPTVAPALQELTGGSRSPSLSDSSEASSVKLCDLFTDSSCTAAGARRKLLRLLQGAVQRLSLRSQRTQQPGNLQQQQQQQQEDAINSRRLVAGLLEAAAADSASSPAGRSLQQRDNLTASQMEGLASWARQAPDSDVRSVQAIVGDGFISRAQATPQLTIDQVVGPQQASSGVGGRRKAARKLLLLQQLLPDAASSSSSVDGLSNGRVLLGDAGGGGAGTASAGSSSNSGAAGGAASGNGAAGSGGDGRAGQAGAAAGASQASAGDAAAAAGTTAAPQPGAAASTGPSAGLPSSQPLVSASSGSSYGLDEWIARNPSPQDVRDVNAIAGKSAVAPGTTRARAEDVKLVDVGGR